VYFIRCEHFNENIIRNFGLQSNGGVVVRALDLRLEIAGSNPSRCTVECDLGQVVHTHIVQRPRSYDLMALYKSA